MKTNILLAVLFSLISGAGYCQFPISVNDLAVPTSPGLVLADKAPATIERPTTPKALSLNLVQLYQGGAIEFNPYWLKDHAAYTFKDFKKDKFPLLKTIGISAATTRNDTSTSLSAGLRVQLVRIFDSKRMDDIQAKTKKDLAVMPAELNTDTLTADLNEIRNVISKPVFNVELAGAYLGTTDNNSYKNLSADKWGAWLHIAWNPSKFPLTFVGLARYSKMIGSSKGMSSDSAFFDYGLNVSYGKSKFDVAAEFVQRHDLAYN